MKDRATIIKKPAFIVGVVEVARSFSYKLQLELYGGPKFESRDFFASQKASCQIEDAEAVSTQLYQFCKSEVLKAVREYIKEMRAALEQKTPAEGSTFKVGRK